MRLASDAAAAAHVHKLLAFGVLPGTSLVLRRCYPAFVVALGFTQIAIDESIASIVLVRPDEG